MNHTLLNPWGRRGMRLSLAFVCLSAVACGGTGDVSESSAEVSGQRNAKRETEVRGRDAEGEAPRGQDGAGDDLDGGVEDADDACPASADRCTFTTYNLDVRVGDRFVLARFVDCAGSVGEDVAFAYPEGGSWNLAAFNQNEVVTITAADLTGGNHGEDRYRIALISLASGDELDKMTIRIDHDDESDIGAGDDQVPAPNPGPVCEPSGGDDSDDSDGSGDPRGSDDSDDSPDDSDGSGDPRGSDDFGDSPDDSDGRANDPSDRL